MFNIVMHHDDNDYDDYNDYIDYNDHNDYNDDYNLQRSMEAAIQADTATTMAAVTTAIVS